MTQLQRLQSSIKESSFDAMLISSSANQRYLSDFDYSDGYMLVSTDKAYLLTDPRYIESARAAVNNFEIILPPSLMSDSILELITQNGYKKIAIEESSMTCSSFETFKNKFKESCELISGASAMLSKQRSVKLPYEIDRMQAAQDITDKAFAHVLEFIKPSMTELDVALELEFFMRRNGADGIAFNTIAVSGSASSLPHGRPSNVQLREGLFTMDFGARYKGYCSDMTRTIAIGKLDEEMKKVYDTVLAAQQNALEKMTVGMLCRDTDSLARDVIKNAGYGEAFGHSLGHGVGIFVHEAPSLSQKADENAKLEAGNVVTVEPGIYLEGRFGCRIEDMVAINADGSVYNFTKSPKHLIEI